MSFEKKTLLHTVRRALSLRALLTVYTVRLLVLLEGGRGGGGQR